MVLRIVQPSFYEIKFIDSARFIFVIKSCNNVAEGIHKIKYKDGNCFLEFTSVKDNLIKYKWLSRNKDYSNKIDEELKKQYKHPIRFYNNNINKFILLLKKSLYPYESMHE